MSSACREDEVASAKESNGVLQKTTTQKIDIVEICMLLEGA
jgi:hypothetical protein